MYTPGTTTEREEKWILSYGPKDKSKRQSRTAFTEQQAEALFKRYESKGFHVDVYYVLEETTKTVRRLTK